MSTFIKNFHTQFLIDVYFSDPKRVVRLKKGEALFRQDQFNDRLFLVKEGKLRGYAVDPDGGEVELFIATAFMFVGVNSFFSTSQTMTNVAALEDSVVAYIGYKDAVDLSGGPASLSEQFLPVIVNELYHRQRLTIRFASDNEKTLKKLIKSEKLASLGQMAAGISHELNNAIAVLEKNVQWLAKQIGTRITGFTPELERFFRIGLDEGRTLSNSEIRIRQKRYVSRLPVSERTAEVLAETGISEDDLSALGDRLESEAATIASYWETGATLRDMLIAAHHATYVVKSVRELGTHRSQRDRHVDVNETIKESLTLLQSDLRRISVDLHFSTLPPIIANTGELIQIWSNIIKNACESMLQARIDAPQLVLSTASQNDTIKVAIQDNGPGIPPEIQDKIFQPNVTTKKEGLSFGLGLGLTIVQRIVESYNGKISVESESGNTVFSIQLPTGATNG
jgi:signal transduction histidine kinase